MANRINRRRRMGATSSWTVLGLVLAFGAVEAQAQSEPAAEAATAPQSEAPAQDDVVQDEGEAIIVVGSRASQQSANARKKNARTATDSIVADDIGSFPDRNVNEAISRVPGVALARNEFGEGEGVALRGNGPDLTRVELDGIGVQSTNAIALGLGRGADMRELPAELVKSIDVVKGSTADMTEGGLGGSIQIRTRTGLDFKKPYVSVRAGAQQNSLGEKWRPDFNAVAGGRFLGDRLGVILSGTYTRVQNNGHNYEITTSNARNYSRLFDFDQSPEKTFSYNPATVGTDAADAAFPFSYQADNTALTPRELVGLAAGATSKAQCLTLFPDNPTGNPPLPGENAPTPAQINSQRTQRILEQQTCLNQWNDYTPSLIRHLMNTQDEKRYSMDARFDFRLTDTLTIYAKGMINNRYVDDRFRTRTPVSMFNQNLQGTFIDTVDPMAPNYRRYRTVAPSAPAGYALIDPNFGLNAVNGGTPAGPLPTFGNVLNVVPSSIVVDEDHNVTKMTLTNNSVGIDEINNIIDSKSRYGQVGAEWRPTERLFVEAFAGMTQTETKRGDMRTGRSYAYGDATLTLQPNGLWDIDLPANYDESNPANFVQLAVPRCVNAAQSPPNCIGQNAVVAGEFVPPSAATPAFTVGQLPAVTPQFSVSYSPALGEAEERLGKFDTTWDTKDLLPLITRVKVGAMYRNNKLDRWAGGGYTVSTPVGTFGTPTYVPGVYVPTANVRGFVRACEPTATSTVSCNYGYVPSADPRFVRQGLDTLTAAEMRDLFAATAYDQESNYFNGLPNRGDLPPAWQGIRTAELFAALGASDFMNFDCIKVCKGSDGKMYDQPVQRTNETIKNIYGMIDFETKLPLGLLFNGNVGLRGVFANVKGSGLLTLTAIKKTATYNSQLPNAAGGTTTQSFSTNTSINSKTTNWLPSFNLNLWAFNETVVLRLYGGKTMSRPTPSNLLPGGTCTIDERIADGDVNADYGCTGRVGNPALAPFSAWNYNAALEWYPNADTLFSVAYGRLDVKIGNPIAVTLPGRPFAGSDLIDSVTGEPLADFEFNVPTWANGPGYKRDIWEFNVKTAFTFLPWFLKHTGFDGNVSILQSVATTGQQDPLSGDVMLPPDESKYYTNASLWYDDGKLNMRVTYQKRSQRFLCITPCGGNNVDINYPGEQWTNVRLVAPGWNPGVARFADGSAFIDAKISYNITRNFQVYLEGRNVMREAQTISTGEYIPFADGTPRIMRMSYGGRRILTGVRIQFGN
jgi:TonB-dependent receptor